MPKCNIDNFGRGVRFFTGFVMFVSGSFMFLVALPGDGMWWRIFQSAMMLIGIFIMFEGALGWCALRALGIKTKF